MVLAFGRGQLEVLVAHPLQTQYLLVEVESRAVLEGLRREIVDEVFSQHFGEAADIVDILLGIQRRDLPA